MATHDLHFAVSTNGVEDPNAFHDDPSMPETPPDSAANNWGRLSQSSHPIVIVFHILFKAAALFLYIFGGWFKGKSGANFVIVTVFCILLTAADFWVVKNVTGRLLVGLRWWNKVEDESTRWIFESAKDRQVNKFDSSVFWTVLYATPVIWGCLFVLGVLKFQFGWLIVDSTALALSGANVYGYYKCSSEQKARFESYMQQGAQAGAMAVLRNSATSVNSSVLGYITGASNQQQNQQPPQATYV